MILIRLWTESNDGSIKFESVSRSDHVRELHDRTDTMTVYVVLHHRLLPYLQGLMERVEMPQEERHLWDLALLFQRWAERFCSEKGTQVGLFTFNTAWQQKQN